MGAQAVTEEAQSASNSSQEEAGLHNTATYTAQLGAAAGAFHIRTETRRTYSFLAVHFDRLMAYRFCETGGVLSECLLLCL